MTRVLTTRRRVLGFFGPFAIAAACALSALASCKLPCPFCPALRDGKHYTQPLTPADFDRGARIAACLQDWARQNGFPTADYSDVDFTDLVIVGVGDPGVAGPYDFVAGRESGDSIFVALRTIQHAPALFVAIELHEMVHIAQQRHPELISANGDIHWAPPWDYCHVVRAIFSSA